MSGRSDSRGRLVLLLIVAMVGSVVLAGRTAYWQVIRHDDLAALAREQGAQAARDLDHAVDLARKRRHAASTVVALTARGRLRTASGSHTGARDDFADAIALARQVRLLPLIPSAAAGRARLSEISGE